MNIYYVINPMNEFKRKYIKLAGKYNLLTAQTKCKQLIQTGNYKVGKFLITTKTKMEIKKQKLKIDLINKINMFHITE